MDSLMLQKKMDTCKSQINLHIILMQLLIWHVKLPILYIHVCRSIWEWRKHFWVQHEWISTYYIKNSLFPIECFYRWHFYSIIIDSKLSIIPTHSTPNPSGLLLISANNVYQNVRLKSIHLPWVWSRIEILSLIYWWNDQLMYWILKCGTSFINIWNENASKIKQ